jgi:hypothetical protein
VQHDGDRRRCRVACRFALILDRDFQADLSPQKSASLRQTRWTLHKFVDQDLFRVRTDARYELTAATAGFPAIRPAALLAQTSSKQTMTSIFNISK